ncbi:hypothetical protein FQN57_000370 [Myotisia sp. PD_48]|nr:hypothetical protein FQN57_000370 [Myotisia sp. PD_48]
MASPGSDEPPGTPPRPPYSPVTPVLSHIRPITPPFEIDVADLTQPNIMSLGAPTLDSDIIHHPGSYPSTQFMPEPPVVPISESDNPDAIALRSAISILQMQKQQALRDIQALDKLKRAAIGDPGEFVKELLAGNLESSEGDVFHPSPLAESQQGRGESAPSTANSDVETMDIDDTQRAHMVEPVMSRFGTVPKPQSIVRIPAINWAKYHIVGEPLDKLHEEQRRRPTLGEPRRDPQYFIAAPYRPFVDKPDTGMKTRSSNK